MSRKTKLFFIISLFYSLSSFAQFTGGSGSGYASALSAVQQLNDTLYNDLAVSSITSPAFGAIIPVNVPASLQFDIQNNGSFPVQTSDSIYISVNTGIGSPQSHTLAPSAALLPGATSSFTLPNILQYTDTGTITLCVTVNGSSFANDSIQLTTPHA